MYEEIKQVKEVTEIEEVFKSLPVEYIFNKKEIKAVEKKNKIKSLGARYLVKKSILDFINSEKGFLDIEIFQEKSGRPKISFTGKVNDMMKEKGVRGVYISMSHSDHFISTLVLID